MPTLIEVREADGATVWINPTYVVRVDWASTNACVITLAVQQEAGGKLKPAVIQVAQPAKQIVAAIEQAQRSSPPHAGHPQPPAAHDQEPPSSATSA